MILIIDTETTGKSNPKLPAEDPRQPHVVQLGAILVDEFGKELHAVNHLIRPNGFEIPEEATNVHHITTEMALAGGVDLKAVLYMFNELASLAKVVVAHNIAFDRLIVEAAYSRLKRRFEFDHLTYFCTMQTLTPIMKLPHTVPGRWGFKWPTLAEAYLYCFGKSFEGIAHDAMADVRACRDLYFWLKKQNENPQTTDRQPQENIRA